MSQSRQKGYNLIELMVAISIALFLMGGALVLISAPVYWLGLVCLYLFANDIGVWHIFPGSGSYQTAHGFFAKCWTLVLPWMVLAAAFAAIYARLLRSNLLGTMSEDYIRTARAKGLKENRVIVRHGLRSTPLTIAPLGSRRSSATSRACVGSWASPGSRSP